MRRLVPVGTFLGFLALAALGACSIINSPEDVQATTGAAGGGTATSTGTGTGCQTAADCPAADDECQQATCAAGVCGVEDKADGEACDDGVFCTENDACAAGSCVAGAPRVCMPANECNTAACDEAAGACVDTPVVDGTPCDDGDQCTEISSCLLGVCEKGESCPSTECSTNVCISPQDGCMITFEPEGTPCGITTCATGSCDPEGKCNLIPQNPGLACDDNLFCTQGETCDMLGQCTGGTPTCISPAECVEATCDEAANMCGIVPIPNGDPCDDGQACTGGETCLNNLCSGGRAPTIYFFDEFGGGNFQGWTLGPEWAIGPTAVGSGQTLGPDPALDHSPSGDNAVVGVVLGGNAATVLHPMQYLESPTIPTDQVPGKLLLTYYRWLNSDYIPYMRNVIEVFDGNEWKEIWTTAGFATQDSAWTFMEHDITEYKNASLRFRFGFEIGSDGVYVVSSWNIDDLKLQNTACPN